MNTVEMKEILPFSYRSSARYEIVSKVGFLLGIPEKVFADYGSTLDYPIFKELAANKNAMIVRNLCILRNTIESQLGLIVRTLRSGAALSVQGVPGLFDPALLAQLNSWGVYPFRSTNKRLWENVKHLNSLISDRVSNCKDLFPDWVNWDYLRSMFIMPGGLTEEGITLEGNFFHQNRDRYPFQVYMGMHPADGDGLVLLNDGKFLRWLYERHEDQFADMSRVRDIDDRTRNSISEYFDSSKNLEFVVDCENSDPFKFTAVLQSLSQTQLNQIRKIILVTDKKASPAWNTLYRYVSIPIQILQVSRLNEAKSLVDPVLVATVCKECYTSSIDSFVLLSSDSDFWGLITTLSDARFLLMVERNQVSETFRSVLGRSGIFYCYLDDFNSAGVEDIRKDIISREVAKKLSSILQENLGDILDEVLRTLYLDVSETERQTLVTKHLPESLVLSVSANGDLSITG